MGNFILASAKLLFWTNCRELHQHPHVTSCPSKDLCFFLGSPKCHVGFDLFIVSIVVKSSGA
jgi:hypothetical protein